MNYSDLKSFFESQTDATTLELLIHDEAEEYKYNVQARKNAAVTINSSENEYFILDDTHFEKLCKAYLDNIIDQYELFYIGDGIQASDNFDFSSRKIAALFSHISNMSVNGPLNQKIVMSMLEGVK